MPSTKGAVIVPDELLAPGMSIPDGSGSTVAGGGTTVLGIELAAADLVS